MSSCPRNEGPTANMSPMRHTAIAILLTLLTYSLAFAIITFRKKLQENDEAFGPPQRVE